MDREKVIKGLHCCAHTDGTNCIYCPYNNMDEDCTALMSMDALALLKKQDEIISELLKVGYPHGYENEEPWIVDYMQLITEVMRKAVRLRNGTD